MIMAKCFNLLCENWIVAEDLQGNSVNLSLVDVFIKAHNIRTLAGETGSQDIAILRFLLGVLYSVFTRVDEKGNDLEDDYDARKLWLNLWKCGRFPDNVITDYLQEYHERFDLLHPTQPFWQVSIDTPPTNEKGVPFGFRFIEASQFIGDIASSANKPNMFNHRTDSNRIGFSEAARWLFHLNAFDVSPGGAPPKSSYMPKGYGNPWLARIGLTWIVGESLFQTLMFNLVLEHNQENWGSGKAWWESEYLLSKARVLDKTIIPPPDNAIELMTMPYRYVKLCGDDDFITGFNLWSGVSFDGTDFFKEKMTPRKEKDKHRIPKIHDKARAMWRDFPTFFSDADNNRPGVLKWVGDVQCEGLTKSLIRTSILGVIYKNNTSVKEIFHDEMSYNVKFLLETEQAEGRWIPTITSILSKTALMVNELSDLAANIEIAKSDTKGIGVRNAAKEEAYFRLDEPFRIWLSSIDPDVDDIDNKCHEWLIRARGIILNCGKELVRDAGTTALVGRIKEKKEYSSAKSFLAFLTKINKIYYPQAKENSND